jgi:hypothetical protein
MRHALRIVFTFGLGLVLAAPASAADKPQLALTDPKLPLQVLRPLDRHVWVLALEGTWNRPATPGVRYYVNVFFPDGASEAHRVLDDALFRKGEVRCELIEYQLVRHRAARGGKLTVVISQKREARSLKDPDVISDRLEVQWPLDRPLVRRPPKTRFTPPDPIDALPPLDK